MSAREEVARLLAEHYWDRLDGCACGAQVGDTVAWAQHVAEVLADPSRGLLCPAPLAHVQVRRG